MRQVGHERAGQAASGAAAPRLRVVQPAEVSPMLRDDHDEPEVKLDYDELARALLRQVLRCLRTS